MKKVVKKAVRKQVVKVTPHADFPLAAPKYFIGEKGEEVSEYAYRYMEYQRAEGRKDAYHEMKVVGFVLAFCGMFITMVVLAYV